MVKLNFIIKWSKEKLKNRIDGVINFIGTRPYYKFNNGEIFENSSDYVLLNQEYHQK